MESTTTRDGTRVAYRREGEGPPLVLVHGSISDHTYWAPILPALAARFTVYAIDRRGRGQSGDSSAYAIEREFEDVAAVVDATGQPANLLGHSYGAICALEAALLTRNVHRLVLYEPPVGADGGLRVPPGFLPRLEAMLAAGDREGVIEAMMREVVGLAPADLAELRSSPGWQAVVATAHTLPRELRAAAAYKFNPQRFRRLDMPAVLLSGEESPSDMRTGTQLVHRTLPNSRIVDMPGQGHEAVQTGPEVLTAAVLRFLTEH